MIDIDILYKNIDKFNEEHGFMPYPDDFPLCGCTSDEVLGVVVRALEQGIDFKTENDVLTEMTNQLLDNAGLFDHGCSIRHCWITDKGKAVLAELQKMAAGDFSTPLGRYVT